MTSDVEKIVAERIRLFSREVLHYDNEHPRDGQVLPGDTLRYIEEQRKYDADRRKQMGTLMWTIFGTILTGGVGTLITVIIKRLGYP